MTTTGNTNDALPLDANVFFSGVLQRSGDYAFLPYTLFSWFGKSPFVADKRQTDVDFGYTQQYIMSGSYTIPANYAIEELPKNIKMIMPDTSIIMSRITQQQDNTVMYRLSIDYRRPQYSAEEYAPLKEFYRKLYALLNEQIVLKKK